MGLFVQQNGPRTRLQEQIAAELQEKLKKKPEVEQKEVTPRFMEGQQMTRGAGPVIVALLLVGLIVGVVILMNPPR